MKWILSLTVIGLMMTATAFAQSAGLEIPAPIAQTATKVGWLSGLMAMALQLAKSNLFGGLFSKIDKNYQPAVVLLLGQIGGLIESVASGKPLAQAAVEWLLASGNAMALYTVVIKPFTKKKEA